MTAKELAEKYGMCEADLYAYASTHLKNYKKRGTTQTGKLSGSALRQLDWLLMDEEKQNDEVDKIEAMKEPAPKTDDWPDPTDDEPDETEVEPPLVEPETTKGKQGQKFISIEEKPESEVTKTALEKEEPVMEEKRKPQALSELAEKAWEKEKNEMYARMEEMQQELAALRHTNLKMQSSTAEKQAELLAKTIQERQLAEERIAVMKQDAESVKHLSNVRIKELEDRNESLEEQVKAAHNELTSVSDELLAAQRVIQEIKDNANKQGAQQKLEILDAQHKQDELFKIIHEKEIALTEEKEKSQEILEKYNGALMRMGEMIGKIEKARTRMRELSAEFDMYVSSDMASEAKELAEAPKPVTAVEEKKPEQLTVPPVQEQIPIPQAPNPETIEVCGKPLHEIYPETSPQQKEQAQKPSLWRKIASFF